MCATLVWYVLKTRHPSHSGSLNERVNCEPTGKIAWLKNPLITRSFPEVHVWTTCLFPTSLVAAQMSDSGDSEMRSCSSSSNAPSEEEDPSSCSSSSSPDSITILVEGDPIDSSVLDKLSPCTRRQEKRVTPVCTIIHVQTHTVTCYVACHKDLYRMSQKHNYGPKLKTKIRCYCCGA